MAAFDFPSSPNVNDIYTLNGVAFMWNGSVWKRYSTSTGAQGFQGAAGAVGAQGAAGVLGGDGAQGAVGAQGAAGNAGSTGAQGASGADGAQGATGAAGAQGAPFDRSEYNYTASGGQTAFAAAYANASDVDVFMNGVRLTPAEYTPSGGTTITLASGATAGDIIDILTFASAGPTGAQGAQGHQGDAFNRSESNFTATSGQTSFAPSGGYTNGDDLDVFVNGVRLTPADYTATNGTNVVLDVGANTGDIVDIIYYEAAGPAGAQGAAGAAGIAGTITFSTSAPSNPIMGDLWYDTDDGAFAGYYNDGNTSQWIDLSGGPRGAQGHQGLTGSGAQGAAGSTGAQGAAGSTGAQGAAGSTGAQGAAGSIPSNITAVNGTFSGDLSIAGTLTYEDVTNIDSVGVITARDTLTVYNAASTFDPHLTLYAENSNNAILVSKKSSGYTGLEFRAESGGGGSIDLFYGASSVQGGNSSYYTGLKLNDNKALIMGTGADSIVRYDPTPGVLEIKTLVSEPIALSTNDTERLRITSAGDVGIGTAVPVTSSGYASLSLADTSGGQIEFKQFGGQTSYIWSDNNLNIAADYYGTGQNLIFTVNGTTERLRITSTGRMGLGTNDPNALLEVRDSENTTQGNAQIRISKGVGGGAAPATISRANTYLHLGGTEWGSGANGKYLIGLGYTNDEVGTGIPAYMGFTETSVGGYTQGDLIFGTRNTTTGTDNATERMRIDKDGHIRFGSSGTGYDSAWSHSNYGNTEVAIDGGGGYGALHFRGDGAGSVNTRFSMGVGDEIFYMCYDDVNARHNIMVNSSGHVRMPQQPAFYAYRAGNSNQVSSGDQIFDTTKTNRGGHYSTSNGRFTAPVAGVYFFSASVQLYGAPTTGHMLSFRINGTDFHGSQNSSNPVYDERAGNHGMLYFSAAITLAANEYVTTWTNHTVRGMQSYFTGYLIG